MAQKFGNRQGARACAEAQAETRRTPPGLSRTAKNLGRTLSSY